MSRLRPAGHRAVPGATERQGSRPCLVRSCGVGNCFSLAETSHFQPQARRVLPGLSFHAKITI